MRRVLIAVLGLLTSLTLLGISCSDRTPLTADEQEPPTVEMPGQLVLPSTEIPADEVRIGLGENEVQAGDEGDFAITGNRHAPGLALAYQDSIPLLLAALPDPADGTTVTLTVRSTALALAFMTPLLCVSSPDGAREIMSGLETLSELDDLEVLLSQKLAADPHALAGEDQEILEAVAAVVIAYVETFPITLARVRPMLRPFLTDEKQVYVLPTTQTFGHEVSHVDGETFKITNAYGRWAYCIVEDPPDTFALSPNGAMFEFLRGRLPWSPSERTFSMTVPEDERDSTHVWVVGYGWQRNENPWGALTAEERTLAHMAGLWTIIFEFAGNLFSVATNAEAGAIMLDEAIPDVPDSYQQQLLQVILTDYPVMRQVEDNLREGKYWEVVWLVANKVMENVTFDYIYRHSFEVLLNRTVGSSAVDKLRVYLGAEIVLAPAMGAIIGNQLTSSAKALLGILKSKFKTTFTVWQEAEKEFGNITGSVHDRESGVPISGATVEISESGINPMPGHSTIQTTGASGGFYFENVLVGNTTIWAYKEGYTTDQEVVVVADGATHTVTLEIEEEYGFAEGKIRNDIKVNMQAAGGPVTSTLFERTAELTARATIEGRPQLVTGSTENGSFRLQLVPGTWTIAAHHPAYFSDSVQVVVTKEETATLSRDLSMAPNETMHASIWLQMLGTTTEVDFPLAHATPRVEDEGHAMLVIFGGQVDLEEFDLYLDLHSVTASGSYVLTSAEQMVNSPGSGRGGFAAYITSRTLCTRSGSQYWMQYLLAGDPDDVFCDCGIAENGCGSFYFTEFGTEIGDVVAGSVIAAKLPSYENCECDGQYNPATGRYDDYSHVICTRAQIDIDFRCVVGSSVYLGTDAAAGPTEGPAQRRSRLLNDDDLLGARSISGH